MQGPNISRLGDADRAHLRSSAISDDVIAERDHDFERVFLSFAKAQRRH